MKILSLLALLPQQEIKDLWVSSPPSIKMSSIYHMILFAYSGVFLSIICFFFWCSWDQRVKSTLLKKEMWCFSASTYNRTLRSQSLCSQVVFLHFLFYSIGGFIALGFGGYFSFIFTLRESNLLWRQKMRCFWKFYAIFNPLYYMNLLFRFFIGGIFAEIFLTETYAWTCVCCLFFGLTKTSQNE